MTDTPEFNPQYRAFIKEQWLRFQNGEDVSGLVRPVIYESWLRCQYWKVPVERIYHEPLSQDEFELLLEEEARLIEVASPILERIYTSTRQFECLFCLANAKGVVLRTWIGKCIPSIEQGTYVQEKNVGTAGMPTCLYTGRPIVIYGAEHYCTPHHEIVCVSNPILDPEGRLIGGITMSSGIEAFHPYSIAVVQEAARSVSEQIRLRSLLATENSLIESFEEGVLVLDRSGNITRTNRRAKTLLRVPALPTKATVDAFFSPFSHQQYIAEGRPFSNEEAELRNGAESPDKSGGYCVLSFNPTEDGGVLTLRPVSEMHAYATKTVGSKAVYHFQDILGQSQAIRECIQLAEKLASSVLTVLLLGESGTGKELFAQSIHNASDRRNQPFIVVNCGALPRELVQSELFGYAEGAFTGARKQGNPGKFELADGGTIFLDEIGEMPLDAQVSLLRLIQNGEVTRIGSKTSRRINVRIIAATNRNMAEAVLQKKFREDLYYRLNVFALHIPPLRERIDDIPVLTLAFMESLTRQHPHFSTHVMGYEAMQELLRRPWPGNVRELEHTVERALFVAKSNVIQASDLGEPMKIESVSESFMGVEGYQSTNRDTSDERTVITGVLQRCEGNVEAAASLLGVSRTTLYTKLNHYGIAAKRYRKLKIKENLETS